MKRFKKSLNIGAYLFCAAGMLLFSTPAHATASVIADSPCDELYYESLSARAWLEAQREITQNQNLILKPDSVFEYTCFDLMVHELADHADEMLSETSSYGSSLGNTSMDTALDNLVLTALENFVTNNYGPHYLLSGHPSAFGLDHNASTTSGSPQAYTCNIMSQVWNAAKCMNFISNSATDGFFTFDEYAAASVATLDARYLPASCDAIPTSWVSNIANALTTGPWTNDDVVTYLSETTPENCSGPSCNCTGSPPIPTGVQVRRSGYSTDVYDEHICLQPGCFYHPGGDYNGSARTAGCIAY